MIRILVILALFIVLLLLSSATGCGFALFESEHIVRPVPSDAPFVADESVQPKSWSDVAAATIRWLTGETEVRREAVRANAQNGFGVEHITRRRVFIINGN